MLKSTNRALVTTAHSVLSHLQANVNAAGNYEQQVDAAKTEWHNKTSTIVKASAFRAIRTTLADMCLGAARCSYCEDSLADEIEHIKPRNFFPETTFVWENLLFACGPCNGPKGTRFGSIQNGNVVEFRRGIKDPVVPPPAGVPALINPRDEDPLHFLELDIGGVLPPDMVIPGTFDFLPAMNLADLDRQRAEFTIDVLGLNREVMRVARENAFGGFRARLREYVAEKESEALPERLEQLKGELLNTPHLTVFVEMRRQRSVWPELNELFELASESIRWQIP